MHRKAFLQTSALVASGYFLFPGALYKGPVVLGHGSKKYQLHKHWCKAIPSANPVNDAHEMAISSNGLIYLLTNDTKNNILVFNKDGHVVNSWGHEYPGAHGLTLHNENGTEFLYITDTVRHEVYKTDLQGRLLMTIGFPKETNLYARAEAFIPTETAIADNGDIYIADGYGKDYIHQYDAEGKIIRSFGGRGSEDRHLLNAHGVCIDKRNPAKPLLWVSSRQEQAFKVFTLAGVYQFTVPMPGAWVCRPVVQGKFLYAAVLQSDSRQGQESGFITIMDENHKNISNPGGTDPGTETNPSPEMYQTIKAFKYPHDVCVDQDENLYVAQWNSGKVYPYLLEPVL